MLPVSPPKADCKEIIACDLRAEKDRNRVDRMVNKLKQFRRIATRYDKTAVSPSEPTPVRRGRATQCARDGVDHPRYLLRLVGLELIDRERRMVERRIRQARSPRPKA